MSRSESEIKQTVRALTRGTPREREEAAEKIYSTLEPKVAAYFAKKGVPPEDVEDLVIDVFARAFRNIDTFRGEPELELRAWLFQIAHNCFANYVRSRNAEKRLASEASLEEVVGSEEDEEVFGVATIGAADEDPLQILIRDQDRARLERALQSLPEKMRQACILRYAGGLKYQEIAGQLGISIETVKAHLFQGRRRVFEALRSGKG